MVTVINMEQLENLQNLYNLLSQKYLVLNRDFATAKSYLQEYKEIAFVLYCICEKHNLLPESLVGLFSGQYESLLEQTEDLIE